MNNSFYRNCRSAAGCAMLGLTLAGLFAAPALADTAQGTEVSSAVPELPSGPAYPGKPELSIGASIDSCTIDAAKTTITLEVTVSGDMMHTDDRFFLFELPSWQQDLSGRTDYLEVRNMGTGSYVVGSYPATIAGWQQDLAEYNAIAESHRAAWEAALAEGGAGTVPEATEKDFLARIAAVNRRNDERNAAYWAEAGGAGAFPIGETHFTFQVPMGDRDARLYSSFVLAVHDGLEYRMVTPRHYITNPEIAAKDRTPVQPGGKKGLSIETELLLDSIALGIKHAELNIPLNHAMGGGGIDYSWKGKTYHFNKEYFDRYDSFISTLTNRGVAVTLVLINGWNDNAPAMFRPGTARNRSAYYVFNTETQEGQETLEAAANFLAERYSGTSGHGRVLNWVIGNEINNQYWNYTGDMEIRRYVTIFQHAFRTFYTAIKSWNSTSNVYFSIDYYWNNHAETNGVNYYTGRDTLDQFNSVAWDEGQIDWGLAYHPYPYPMNDPVFWNDGENGLTQDENSPVVNFYNLHVLTDYMQRSELRSPSGNVRHIILSEQGFTSTTPTGEKLAEQAAAYAYSYYLVESNPYIDAYLLARQIDAPSEVRDGISFGLFYCDMNHPDRITAYHSKPIYYIFKDIDKPGKTLEVSASAKQTLGIGKWSELIPDFAWAGSE